MKVGIITLQGNNYGATLQAVALNYMVNHMGCTAENLDYNDLRRVKRGLSLRAQVKNQLWNTVKTILVGHGKEKAFDDYRKQHLVLSKEKWTSQEALKQNPPRYDLYISGSDQIWNPDVINGDYNYLLAFVPQGGRKAAYASSFGKKAIQGQYADTYRMLLADYDDLSVREASGKELIKQLTGRDAQVVLDPTLLLNREQWTELADKRKEPERYILCYYMPGDKIVTDAIRRVSKQLEKETGLHVINLGLKEYFKLVPGMDCRVDAGPGEFVRLFLDAEYVVTNSFHGMAFSVNFGKKLCVPVNGSIDASKARHTRLLDFLKMVHYEDAICYVTQSQGEKTDFQFRAKKTNSALELLRTESLDYLKRILEGA